MVKKITGSVVEVVKAHTQDETHVHKYQENKGYEVNKPAITMDLPRIHLVDFTGMTFNDFINECATEANYHQHYKQGDFDGGDVVDVYALFKLKKIQALIAANREEEADRFSNEWNSLETNKTLRFAYRDGQGQLCALGLAFNATHPESWALHITQNTTAPLEGRTATLFASGELSEAITCGTSITELSDEIKSALGDDKIAQLISGLIDINGRISLEKFEELTTILDKMRAIWDASSVENQRFKKALDQIINRIITLASNDIDYFRHISMEDIKQLKNDPIHSRLIQINLTEQENEPSMIAFKSYVDSIKEAENTLKGEINFIHDTELDKRGKQSFFKRNTGQLILLGVSLLAMVSIALVLTGVLAPLGLALATGLATYIAIGATAVIGALSVGSGFMIAKQERKLNVYQQALNPKECDLLQGHHQKIREIEATYAVAVASIPEITPTVEEHADSVLGSSQDASPASSPKSTVGGVFSFFQPASQLAAAPAEKPEPKAEIDPYSLCG